MHQKDVAARVDATTSTVTNWEKGRTNPRLCFLPRVFQFLGYEILPDSGSTIGEKIKTYRRKKGLSIKKLARILSVDPTTLARWERGECKPIPTLRNQLNMLISSTA
jgi:transcriptional regulator with XRE-family HTH domain